jgi:hypothetical protein
MARIESLNWHVTDSERKRRRNALSSRHNSAIQTAHALLGLSNQSSNRLIKHRAHSDAVYFFELHKKREALKRRK